MKKLRLQCESCGAPLEKVEDVTGTISQWDCTGCGIPHYIELMDKQVSVRVKKPDLIISQNSITKPHLGFTPTYFAYDEA